MLQSKTSKAQASDVFKKLTNLTLKVVGFQELGFTKVVGFQELGFTIFEFLFKKKIMFPVSKFVFRHSFPLTMVVG